MDASERRARATGEAADWWTWLQAEEGLPHEQRVQFIEWLRESPVHVAELMRIARVHDELALFDAWPSIAGDVRTSNERNTVVELRPRDISSRSPRKGIRLPIFAGLIAAVTLIAVVLVFTPGRFGQTIDTERGERRELALNDGSFVVVDPQSRLRVKYTRTERRLILEHGRAIFRVAGNSQRPFRVQAGKTTIQALGTEFGVDSSANTTTITVAEGKVAVLQGEIGDGGQRLFAAGEPQKATVVLSQNQQISVAPAGNLRTVRSVDSQNELAWASGRLIFKDTPASEVIAEFNRYNRLQLRITDASLAHRPVSAVFNAANPEAFVAFLQEMAAVRVDRDGDQSITISRKESP